ncbi:MAG: 3-hydroxyacyl-CoA dehydrogenase [Gammaproteobacteria bacterium]|nr:3-hydroxyacyl-CoA dehydrogenase [Gammaproteobacteria bacterium]
MIESHGSECALPVVAVVGAGTIGASLTALFVAHGIEVRLFDKRADAQVLLEQLILEALPDLDRLGIGHGVPRGNYRLWPTLKEACHGVTLVIEATAERLEAKQSLLAEIETAVSVEAVIASTTSSFLPSQLQARMAHPARLIVAHPFNPPHLVPLVEIVGSPQTQGWALDRAVEFFAAIGRKPVRLNRESVGHLANRLTAALYREAVSLVADGIASVQDVDDAVRYGPGLRWAIMGPHMIYHLAAGDGGYRQYLDHLGPTQQARWQDLRTPTLTEDLCEQLVAGVAQAAKGVSVAELRAQRDSALVSVLRALNKAE